MRPLKIKGSGLLSIAHLYRWNASDVILSLHMASSGVHCCGCGCDITGGKGNRLLKSEASQRVVPLWLTTYNEELEVREKDKDGTGAIMREGRLCRKCYAAYERCFNLLKTLKAAVVKAVDALQPSVNVLNDIVPVSPVETPLPSNRASDTPKRNQPPASCLPATKRLLLDNTGSPEVIVGGMHI